MVTEQQSGYCFQQVRIQMLGATVHVHHCIRLVPKGDTDLVETLLYAGALSHRINEGGLTPLAVAERRRHSKVCIVYSFETQHIRELLATSSKLECA